MGSGWSQISPARLPRLTQMVQDLARYARPSATKHLKMQFRTCKPIQSMTNLYRVRGSIMFSIAALKHYCIWGAVWCPSGSIFGPWVIIGFPMGCKLVAWGDIGIDFGCIGADMIHLGGAFGRL